MIKTTLITSGIGRKDSNAALAAEFFATLEATHGNSAQHRSLTAILRRAEERFAVKRDAVMARRYAAVLSTDEPVDEPTPEPVKSSKPKSRKSSKVRTVESDDAAAVDDDASSETDFVARMRKVAAQNERDGIRN